MSWLDRLTEEISAKVVEKPAAPAAPPKVHEVTITVRNATENDPGEITTGYYVVANGLLTMMDARGEAIGAPIALGPAEAAAVARNQLRQRWGETGGGFNRCLEYPPLPIA